MIIREAVSGTRVMRGLKPPRPSIMLSMLTLEKAKVRKVNRARGIRAQKGARIRAPRAIRASLGTTQKMAEAIYPPMALNHALCKTVVSWLMLPIVTAGHANREASLRAILL